MRDRVAWLGLSALALAGCVGPNNGASNDAGVIVLPSFDSGIVISVDGSVPASCLGGTLCADGKCHDLVSDHDDCGACGTVCAAGQVCSAGACALTCGGGTIACSGSCIDPQTNGAHCGASADCTGTNVGAACATGEACVAGKCVAACGSSASGSLRVCSGVCTDTDFDLANCGACGKPCTTPNGTPACVYGVCHVTACAAGFADCNRDPSDGCEENLQTSALNCGACGQACTVGPCTAGACGPDPEWSSGPLPPDARNPGDFVVEHGGVLFDVDGGALDASLGTIADAAIDASANGTSVDASACVEAGTLTVDVACVEAGTCDDVVFDRATGLLWARSPSASASSLPTAQCYCASLQIAGLSGWRLPSRLELATVPDYSRVNPAMNSGAFPFATTAGARLATSSVSKFIDPPNTYELFVSTGVIDEWGLGGTSTTVLCVR